MEKDGRWDFRSLIAPRFLCRMHVSDTHEHVTFVYFARTSTDQLTLSTNELTDGVKWFSKEEIGDPALDLEENVRFYARTALEEVM